MTIHCRDSWLLGTACGHCSRCAEEAPATIAHLRERLEHLEDLERIVRAIVPQPCDRLEMLDHAKVRLFDAPRALIWSK